MNELLNLALSMLDFSIEAMPLRIKADTLHTRYNHKHKPPSVIALPVTMLPQFPWADLQFIRLRIAWPYVPVAKNKIGLYRRVLLKRGSQKSSMSRMEMGLTLGLRRCANSLWISVRAGMESDSE